MLRSAKPGRFLRNLFISRRAFLSKDAAGGAEANLPPPEKSTLNHPLKVELEPGKVYSWCTCGYSQKQPFCDGVHKRTTTGLKSLKFQVEQKEEKYLCACKLTKTPPYCDGTHKCIKH